MSSPELMFILFVLSLDSLSDRPDFALKRRRGHGAFGSVWVRKAIQV